MIRLRIGGVHSDEHEQHEENAKHTNKSGWLTNVMSANDAHMQEITAGGEATILMPSRVYKDCCLPLIGCDTAALAAQNNLRRRVLSNVTG